MWEIIELRELRVFLTLADELHFGRTAERLRLTPSRVRQRVRGLEQKLGAQLAHRDRRRHQDRVPREFVRLLNRQAGGQVLSQETLSD